MASLSEKLQLSDMMNRQLQNIPVNRRLLCRDLLRIAKYIPNSIFDGDKCCIWTGYITNNCSQKKGTYINFFFRRKKVALHRLLYENFVGNLGDNCYLKFTCSDEENKGKCCNINHMVKFRYNETDACSDDSDDSSDFDETELQKCDPKKNDPIKVDKIVVRFD